MSEQEYLDKRVQNQLEWFETKSAWNQKRYKRLKILTLALSVLIPFLVGFINENREWPKIIVGLAGVLIAIAEGLLSVNKYQDNWLQYRASAEAIKREQHLYVTKTSIYGASENPFTTFVEEIEKILSKDVTEWKKYIAKDDVKSNVKV